METRTFELQAQVQKLTDESDIRQVLSEYCHGCDRMDHALMVGTYAPDSWDDHGRYKCSGQEYAGIVMREMQATNVLSHHLNQSLIRLSGDVAGAETYFLAVVGYPSEDGGSLNLLGGRYVDELERTGAGWRIKHRACVRDWSLTLPVEQDRLSQNGFIAGRRDGDDVSYKVLELLHRGPGVPSRAPL